jgi:hypothetical protein
MVSEDIKENINKSVEGMLALLGIYKQASINKSEEIKKLIIDTQNAVRNGR